MLLDKNELMRPDIIRNNKEEKIKTQKHWILKSHVFV